MWKEFVDWSTRLAQILGLVPTLKLLKWLEGSHVEMVSTGSLVHLSLHCLQYIYIRLLFVTKRALDTMPKVFQMNTT